MKRFFEFVLMVMFVSMIAASPVMVAAVLLVVILGRQYLPEYKPKWGDEWADVNVMLANGQLGGTLQTNDGVVGMVLTGVTDDGGYTVGDTLLVTGLANLAVQGITEADNAFAYKQVKEFYDEVGDGADLYLMLVPSTMTVNLMADNTNDAGARKLLLFAQGKIKVLGLLADDVAWETDSDDTVTIAHAINGLVYTAAANMRVMAADFFDMERPFRCVIGATSYTGVAANLTDETAGTTNNRVAILLGDTVSGRSAAVGLLLGRAASIPVMRKISRIKDGPLTNIAVFLDITIIEEAGADPATIAGKGYITFKIEPTLSGYYFSSDPMCTATTDDYRFLARGRVIDKAHILTYAVYVQEVDDEVPTVAGGLIDPGFAKYLQQQVINMITNTMVANHEISAVDCFVDPNQNILATNTIAIVVKVRPVGYATDIDIALGFES